MSFTFEEGHNFVIVSSRPDWIISQLHTLWYPGFAVTRIDVRNADKLGASILTTRMREAHMVPRTLLCICLPEFFPDMDQYKAFARTTANLIIESGTHLHGFEAELFDELSTVVDSQTNLQDIVERLQTDTAVMLRNIATIRSSYTFMFH